MRAIEIKNRFTSKVIYRHEFENNTLKITCMRAVLDKINLRGANLSDADLRDADLRGANLSDANLRGANLRYFPLLASTIKPMLAHWFFI